jgi:hypothetical protein
VACGKANDNEKSRDLALHDWTNFLRSDEILLQSDATVRKALNVESSRYLASATVRNSVKTCAKPSLNYKSAALTSWAMAALSHMKAGLASSPRIVPRIAPHRE